MKTFNKRELIDLVLYKQKELEICVDEIERLNNIIKEAREYIENCLHNLDGTNDSLLKQCIETIHKYLLEILDKENK